MRYFCNVKTIVFFLLLLCCLDNIKSQHSVARQWNEVQLAAIRKDLGRPTVQARNLFHLSLAMYDAWAVFDSTVDKVLLGKTFNGYDCIFNGFSTTKNLDSARNEAISYAAFKLLHWRYKNSPNYNSITKAQINNQMMSLGYDMNFTSMDYSTGNPAALGNYIAQCVIDYGLQDGANEAGGYANTFYAPVNQSMIVVNPGNPRISNPNRWQPLTLEVFIDQNGNQIPGNTPPFLSPEWGKVGPFALLPSQRNIYNRAGKNYIVYHDPGAPVYLDTTVSTPESEMYKWNFDLVAAWSGHLDPKDSVKWDISPKSSGNISSYPQKIEDYPSFYNFNEGGDPGKGYALNPKTGMPYEAQIVNRGDYTRALAEFWADGPNSETPPGHWFTIINYVSDQPELVKRFAGKGPILNDLEWDVKCYLTLGGSLHDAAVTVWGIKGWYDYVRPISALRKMADLGQSTDPALPHYHVGGVQLVPGKIEIVMHGDSLAGPNDINVGKIKFYAWRGPNFINNPMTDEAGTAWILAENWMPYQRPTFVTPPFAGYISGHSTFSRTAAEILTSLTGDPFFPGGYSKFDIKKDQFLVFEDGPSQDFQLQWATYRDASDQCSLSRIWGGIHPPTDDIPGRIIGMDLAKTGFDKAQHIFYKDEDNDGYFTYEDCDDLDGSIHPGIQEICDGIDNDCDGLIDDSIQVYRIFADEDHDGFGDAKNFKDTCMDILLVGFVKDSLDCNDKDSLINPLAIEICDGKDNDCDGLVDDSLQIYRYYLDVDMDGFGDLNHFVDTCASSPIFGYTFNATDCNDKDSTINPNMSEVCDGKDNDCNGQVDDNIPIYRYYFDADNDGFGDFQNSKDTCLGTGLAGYVKNGADCDDFDAQINPNASEICDGKDNDCNGKIDDNLTVYHYYKDADGDGYGDPNVSLDTCIVPPYFSYVLNNVDCNDKDNKINPSFPEICDGIDNDCDGMVDDSLTITRYYIDIDEDGFGNENVFIDTCAPTSFGKYVKSKGDCNDNNSTVYPRALEICDGLDNDCDGVVDDSLKLYRFYRDADADGFGNPAIYFDVCVNTPIGGFVSNNEDCNDMDKFINPLASEICDDKDNNCDGNIDEGFSKHKYFADTDGDGYGDIMSFVFSCDTLPGKGFVSDSSDCNDDNALAHPNAAEICDGSDNNCNGVADEGLMKNRYYRDSDKDGFGDDSIYVDTCLTVGLLGYVGNDDDCDDMNPMIHPGVKEILDSLDNDCNGLVDDNIVATKDLAQNPVTIYPNPFEDKLNIKANSAIQIELVFSDLRGIEVYRRNLIISNSAIKLDDLKFSAGIYIVSIFDSNKQLIQKQKFVKI